MQLGFTGHRNKITTVFWFQKVFRLWPPGNNTVWVHGGAEGFDSQVQDFAEIHGIETEIIQPDYDAYPKHLAPLARNRQIVNSVTAMVACWDGRDSGGTFYTMKYAASHGHPILVLPARLRVRP